MCVCVCALAVLCYNVLTCTYMYMYMCCSLPLAGVEYAGVHKQGSRHQVKVSSFERFQRAAVRILCTRYMYFYVNSKHCRKSLPPSDTRYITYVYMCSVANQSWPGRILCALTLDNETILVIATYFSGTLLHV